MNARILEQVAIGFIQVLQISLTLDSSNITKWKVGGTPFLFYNEEERDQPKEMG